MSEHVFSSEFGPSFRLPSSPLPCFISGNEVERVFCTLRGREEFNWRKTQRKNEIDLGSVSNYRFGLSLSLSLSRGGQAFDFFKWPICTRLS